jgi:hypothetical protein
VAGGVVGAGGRSGTGAGAESVVLARALGLLPQTLPLWRQRRKLMSHTQSPIDSNDTGPASATGPGLRPPATPPPNLRPILSSYEFFGRRY